MKLIDVNPSMCFGFNEENNKEGSIFKIGNFIRIST